jgi:hypothetical protein
MNHLTDSIKFSIQSKNWYSAIAVSLTLPDICSKITYGEKSSGKKYAEWFDSYVGNFYKTDYTQNQLEMAKKYSASNYAGMLKGTKLSGNDCYALRCAFLHEGLGEISTQRAREILDEIKFLEPNYQLNMHGSIINNKLLLHIDEFCTHILQGVEKWKNDLNVEQTERFNTFLMVKNIFDFVKEKN